jgi:hypothetical protein
MSHIERKTILANPNEAIRNFPDEKNSAFAQMKAVFSRLFQSNQKPEFGSSCRVLNTLIKGDEHVLSSPDEQLRGRGWGKGRCV